VVLRATGELEAARGAALVQGVLFLVLLAWLLPRSSAGPGQDMAARWAAMALDTALLIYGLGLLPAFLDGALLLLNRPGSAQAFPWWLALGLAGQLLAVSLAASALKPVPSFPGLMDGQEEGDPASALLARMGPHLDEVLLALDSAGRIAFANPAAATLLGIPGAQIPGMPLLEALSFLAPADAQRILDAVERKSPMQERLGIPMEPRRLLGVALLPGVGGGSILLLRRERGVLAGEPGEEAQAERLLALGSVVAGVVRELNTPLTGLLGFLQLAHAQEGLTEEARSDLARAREEAERCRRTLDNLLAFVSRDRPGARLVDLGELLQQTLSLVEGPFSFGGFQIHQELEPRPLKVMASPHRLQQVLLNLLHHAYGSALKSGWRIGLRLSQVGSRVRLEISDSGPALDERDRSRLFEPTPGDEGANLGLIVARRVVRDHHGTLECLSAEGAGNLFLMELPLVREAPLPVCGLPGDLSTFLAEDLNSPSARVYVAAIPGSPVERLAEPLRSLGHQVEVSSRDLGESSGSWQILFVEAPLAGPWIAPWARRGARVVVVGSTDRELPPDVLLVPEVDSLATALTGL